MSLIVRPANLESEQEILIDTLSRYLNPHYDKARFNWLYKENPAGLGSAWLLSDTESETVVGVAGAFPRKVYIDTHEALCWVLGDFCIHENYRSLGPALQLQRACLEGVDASQVAYCYDFPSTRMLAVYKRLRIEPVGQVYRFAKPLRVDRRIKERIPVAALGKTVGVLGNLALALRDVRWRSGKAVEITLHAGECGEEFARLARDLRGQYGVCIQRTSAYLNWRYLANPLEQYEMLVARRQGRLMAYAVFLQQEEDAVLVDFFGIKDRTVMRRLLDHVIALLRKRHVMTCSVALIESHPWLDLFQSRGFQAREARPAMVYIPAHTKAQHGALTGMPWFLMHGDRDS